MPTYVASALLFLSSYSPLLGILAVRNMDEPRIALALGATAVLSVIALVWFLRVSRRTGPFPLRATRVQPRDGDLVSYLVSYLVPFLDVNFKELADALSLLILFLAIGVLYVHSNMIYVNPVLAVAGYHLFDIESDEGRRRVLLAKRRFIQPQEQLSVVSLGEHVVMEKTHDGT